MLLKSQSFLKLVLNTLKLISLHPIGIGGPQLSVDQNQLHFQAPIHKQVHSLPHSSLNGVPLDDDPLTLDIWEDKEEHFTDHKREKRSASTPPGMALLGEGNRGIEQSSPASMILHEGKGGILLLVSILHFHTLFSLN